MDTSGIVILVVLLAVVLVAALLYRRGSFKAGMKWLGASLEVEGQASPPADAARPGEGDPGKSTASAATETQAQQAGDRTVQVGRDATGTFVTGDNNRVAQVKGDRNRIDQAAKGKK